MVQRSLVGTYYRCVTAKSVWGECPSVPRRVREAACAHARELGRDVVSDDLFLLALTGLDETQPARRAPAQEGVDAHSLLAKIRTEGDRGVDASKGLTFSPAYYSFLGRAQGFAAALGDGKITPEHVLLAVLWDPMSGSSGLLWRLGVSRERVVERLGDLGVAVPAVPLPAQRPIEYGERVWFERADVRAVLDEIRLRVSPDTRWGFNYDGDRAWALAEASVDLEALVKNALTKQSG